MSKSQLKSLFQRIGGEPQLKIILRDFYSRMSSDILIGFFFTGKDTRDIADKQLEFLLYAAELRATYEGKNPTSAHMALPPILSGHFDRRLVILEETLRDNGVSAEDMRIWIEFENAFRNVIVQ